MPTSLAPVMLAPIDAPVTTPEERAVESIATAVEGALRFGFKLEPGAFGVRVVNGRWTGRRGLPVDPIGALLMNRMRLASCRRGERSEFVEAAGVLGVSAAWVATFCDGFELDEFEAPDADWETFPAYLAGVTMRARFLGEA